MPSRNTVLAISTPSPLNGHEPPNAVSIVFAPALGASAEPKEEELEKGGGAVPEDAYCPEPAAPTNLLFVPPFPSVGKKKKSIEGIPPREERLNFAVCVKGISFLDPSMAPRLAEWIELVRLVVIQKCPLMTVNERICSSISFLF